MSDGYLQLYECILDSSVWLEDQATRIVWITMLLMGGKKGVVSASLTALARRANVSREECEHAIERLSAPDPDSRSQDHDGRRIEAIEGGWRLLNHNKYRNRRGNPNSAGAQRVRNHRKRQQQEHKPLPTDVTPGCNAEGVTVTPGVTHEGITPQLPRYTAGGGGGASAGDDDQEGGAGGNPPADVRVPCPPDLELTPGERIQLEQSPGIPPEAIDRATPWARARFESHDPRTVGQWRRSLLTTLVSWWNEPRKHAEMRGLAPPRLGSSGSKQRELDDFNKRQAERIRELEAEEARQDSASAPKSGGAA